MADFFTDIGMILLVATVLAAIARFVRQPLILAYIIAGIVLGPVGLKLIIDYPTIQLMSEIGIALLLFVVGLELDVRKIKNLGTQALIVGICQVVFTFIIGYYLLNWVGFTQTSSLWLSIAFTLSSTVIVVKLLSDKGELATLHGRIALGILLVQDFIAIIVMGFVEGLSGSPGIYLIVTLLKAAGMFIAALLLGTIVFPFIFNRLSASQELLFLAGMAWFFIASAIAKSMGFSIAMGSFLAGVSLASMPYNVELIGKAKPLRDFFATIFFITVGMQITPSFQGVVWPIIASSAFILLGNPLIVLAVMSVLGFKPRPGFLTGISVAQVSEFSLIIIAMGVATGILPQQAMSVMASVALITFAGSSYMIIHSDRIYNLLAKPLQVFSKLSLSKAVMPFEPEKINADVVLVGANRMGFSVMEACKKTKRSVFVLDYNPEVIRRLERAGIPALYGDLGDLETIEKLPLEKALLVVSTVPDLADNKALIRKTRQKNKKAAVIVTATWISEALELYSQGADYVLLPQFIGGQHVHHMLTESKDFSHIKRRKDDHVRQLKERRKRVRGG